MSYYLENSANQLSHLAKNLDFNPLLRKFKSYNKVVFFGLGKSYLACKLSVAIANSYGLKWYLVSAASALHGDMGIVGPRDLVVLVSNSGETSELLALARHFNEHNTLSITSSERNSLADACEDNFVIPIESENSPFGQSPMYSSVAYAMVLNQLTSFIVFERGLSHEHYSNNHPSGTIGERTNESI